MFNNETKDYYLKKINQKKKKNMKKNINENLIIIKPTKDYLLF
jgi:hypothetical protein